MQDLTLNMEVAWSSKGFVSFCITIWCQNPQGHDLKEEMSPFILSCGLQLVLQEHNVPIGSYIIIHIHLLCHEIVCTISLLCP